VPESVRRWIFNSAGYNQYGLYYDDCLDERKEGVQEALRRLPRKLHDERSYRIVRAQNASMNKVVLPKEQWTTYEDDLAVGRYLQPYLKEVREEIKDRERWDNQ